MPAALQDLSAIRAALEETSQQPVKAKQSSCQGKGGGKKRMHVTQAETGRLQQVLQHPVYKQDPVAALQEHLKATLPAPAEQPQEKKAQQRPPRNRKRGKIKGVAALSGAIESMQLS